MASSVITTREYLRRKAEIEATLTLQYPPEDDSGERHSPEVNQALNDLYKQFTGQSLANESEKPSQSERDALYDEYRSSVDAVYPALSPDARKDELAARKNAPRPENSHDYELAMPSNCLYGVLGEAAKSIGGPLGFAYVTMLTLHAGSGVNLYRTDPRVKMPTLFSILMANKGVGKSMTKDRCIQTLYPEGECDHVLHGMPLSDRGLLKMVTEPKSKKSEVSGPNPRVLVIDEFKGTLVKMGYPGSTLATVFNEAFYATTLRCADKTGVHETDVRLSLLGLLKVEDPDEFTQCMTGFSQGGFYDRLVLVPCTLDKWYWSLDWKPTKFDIKYAQVTMPKAVSDFHEDWRSEFIPDDVGNRIDEIARRVAMISASANGDTEVTLECMLAAHRFMDWQIQVRRGYVASSADNPETQLATSIIKNLTDAGVTESGQSVWVKRRDMERKGNWNRKYGPPMIFRVLEAMSKGGGPVIAAYHQRKNGKDMVDDRSRPNGKYRLRQDDGVDSCL